MRPPKRIKVGPFTFDTVEDDAALNVLGGSGAMNYDLQVIVYGTGSASEQLKDTVLHETLHAIIRQTRLYESNDEWVKLEEGLVQAMTPILLGVLRENPRLVTFLTESAK